MEPSDKRIQLRIGGMTCVNCQNKIEKELKKTKGIVSARVSYKKGVAEIIYRENEVTRREIAGIVKGLDYEVYPDHIQERIKIGKSMGTLLVIVLLYVLLQSLGILNHLVPSQLADTKMGYGMLFVIGLLTSVHCIAMCGGINLSQCIPGTGKTEEQNSRLSIFRPALAYNMGRVLSYTLVGLVLGLIGSLLGTGMEIGFSTFLQGILKMAAGLCMVIMGINLLGLFPWLRKFTIRMPGAAARKIGKKKDESRRPFIVGILNGFMPCGPLQSMWTVALASGNPFAGALSMFLFSLGTVPLMLGLGSIVSALGRKFTDKVMTVSAVLVVVLGLAMLSQGGSLSGWLPPDLLLVLVIAFGIAGILASISVGKRPWKYMLRIAAGAVVVGSCVLWNFQEIQVSGNSQSDADTEMAGGVQVVNSTLEPSRYPNITVKNGTPVRWIIEAPEGSVNGCNYKMLIPDYDISYEFHTGENVIEFTPTQTGTVRYSCWMGIIYGSIFVTDGTESEGGSAEDAKTESTGEIPVPVPAGYEIPADRIAIAALAADQSENPYQTVSITLTDDGFSPAVIVVQKALAAVWNIDNQMTDVQTEKVLLAPCYSTQLTLKEGENQLSLYPTESFDVSTGDNRFYCYIKVVDDLSAVDEESVKAEAAAFETLIYPAEVFESAGMSCCG